MNYIELELEGDERLKFEFSFYQHNGAKIALNMFTNDSKRDYTKEHVENIETSYYTTYILMNSIIENLLASALVSKVKYIIKHFNYNDGILSIQYDK